MACVACTLSSMTRHDLCACVARSDQLTGETSCSSCMCVRVAGGCRAYMTSVVCGDMMYSVVPLCQ